VLEHSKFSERDSASAYNNGVIISNASKLRRRIQDRTHIPKDSHP
jgi:hypothetical protein